MIVTFISQCKKKALPRTRRVLDAFANRIGDNVWQTVITQEGLNTAKKLLGKTASKNTAVACHIIKTRQRTELAWIIGSQQKFNAQGIVPVNSTQKALPSSSWENHWQHAEAIQIIAALAALLHDLGKASTGFQNKLKHPSQKPSGDPYRHEWISLRLFQAMIAGCKNDEDWLNRLGTFADYQARYPNWHTQLLRDDNASASGGFHQLPPLAKLLSWLIVTHHRLPFYEEKYYNANVRSKLQKDDFYLQSTFDEFYEDLRPTNGWVRNARSCDERNDTQDFWQFQALATDSKRWQKAMSRWCNKALNHPPLLALTTPTARDPFTLHLARLCLMIGDHNYSSLTPDDKQRTRGDADLKTKLIANTDKKTKAPKQALDEHLLGVAKFTARFARQLPGLSRQLPAVEQHSVFTKPTPVKQFVWQNKAFQLARRLQESTQEQGFFGVNMASTGCGKTLGNARIMAGLSSPEAGIRFTIALGLRVLTLQTGQALRERLQLDNTQLAILVGGSAQKKLFELQHEEKAFQGADELTGSESAGSLVDEIVYGEHTETGQVLGTVIADSKARDLLFSPIVTCTVDHMISASESLRGGKHIAPMLRLLSSDLILDEPDDFSQEDLPALTRLVHFAGLFGSKVLLSSATLTPDLVAGLFAAYQAGRTRWNKNNGFQNNNIVCAWFDEARQSHTECTEISSFEKAHQLFTIARVDMLESVPVRRKAAILPIDLPPVPEGKELHYPALADTLLSAAVTLHQQHHDVCPQTGKTLSVGLIRLANIQPLVQLAQAFYPLKSCPDDTQVHLCCYHANQLLLLRNALENKLDRILNRNDESALFYQPEIQAALHQGTARHHIFIVFATPVAEVGRDHSYSWAIIEPSSMRSVIQLAGRIWRHQPNKIAEHPNLMIMDSNIKALKYGNSLGVGKAVFTHPGFEEKQFLLQTHCASELITPAQLKAVDARPRIIRPEPVHADSLLADLEHAVMQHLLNPSQRNFVNAFWQSEACYLSGHLQKISPFRWQDQKEESFVCLPDEQGQQGFSFVSEEKAWQDRETGKSQNRYIKYTDFLPDNPAIHPWLGTDVQTELTSLAEQSGSTDLTYVARRYATVSLKNHEQGWHFHPWWGFWRNN